MEVVSANVRNGDFQRHDVPSLDMNRPVLILERPFDSEKARARDHDAVLLEYVRGKDDIGNAGFVFEREEDKALGGARSLTGNDATGNAHIAIVPAFKQLLRRKDALVLKSRTVIGHWMRAGGESGSRVIG